jgi:hypothetical protein
MVMLLLTFLTAWFLAGCLVWGAFAGLGLRFAPIEADPEMAAPGNVFDRPAQSATPFEVGAAA